MTVANRISFSAHLTNLAEDGLPTDRLIAYLAERARGGTGLIITEEQSVHPTDRAYEHLIEAFLPQVIPGYKKLTRAVHEFDTRIFAQLNHNGQQCSGSLPACPSGRRRRPRRALPRDPEGHGDRGHRGGHRLLLPRGRARARGRLRRDRAAVRPRSLVRQFLSPLTNYRGDEYGGDDERRLRFALELVAAVRQAVGEDYTMGVRLCADELIPGGLTLDDAKRIAGRLQATGHLDFFNLTLSTFYNLYLVGGTMHLPLGYTVPLAAGMKSVVTLPVFATGRINDPALAERVLADGQADMIGVVRGQIADPEFASKARDGRADEIRSCIACNQNCYGRVGLNKSIGCVQNPAAGAESTEGERHLVRTLRSKRVAVVGGGPAGMWAAKVASLRGHDVALYESGPELGGQVLLAMKGAGRDEFGVIVRNERRRWRNCPCRWSLDHEVTAGVAGGRPRRGHRHHGLPAQDLPGGRRRRAAGVQRVAGAHGEVDLGERVLLIDYDGHHQATATAEALATAGKTVHIVTSSLFVGSELGPSQDLYLTRQRLLQAGVTFTPDYAVMEITRARRSTASMSTRTGGSPSRGTTAW